jgi:excisionase family DNA binding protein
MRNGLNRTIEDRLEDIEKQLLEVKSMVIMLSNRQTKIADEKEEEFMNVKDVTRFIKVESAVIYAACNKGEIPYLKVGKMYKFKKADVLKWVEKDKKSLIDVDAYVDKYLQKHTMKG